MKYAFALCGLLAVASALTFILAATDGYDVVYLMIAGAICGVFASLWFCFLYDLLRGV